MIEFGHLSHVGLRREHNEDTYYGDGELGLWLVADGMGGHEFGEVASALARDTIVREIRAGRPLAQAIQAADEEIIKHSRRRADLDANECERSSIRRHRGRLLDRGVGRHADRYRHLLRRG